VSGTSSNARTAPFTLYGRAWCHLCDDMRAALAPIAAEHGVAIEWIDIDADSALEARYDELVPVLVLDGVELCHYHLDEPAVRAALEARKATLREPSPHHCTAAQSPGRRGSPAKNAG
jgi:glutaredoxin